MGVLSPFVFMTNNLINKIANILQFLRKFNSKFEKYHCAFSGGKDSIVLEYLLRLAACNYDLFFYDNVLNFPEIRRFIRLQYPHTIFLKPKYNFLQLVERKKILPTSIKRYCCQYFKECFVSKSIILTGIRRDESCHRSNRYEMEILQSDFYKGNKVLLNPLLDLTNQDIWSIIKEYNITVPDLYDKYNRVGCVGCPMSNHKSKELLIDYPKFGNMWYKAACRVFELNPQNFTSGRDVFEWYLSNVSVNCYMLAKSQGIFNF